MPLPDHLLHGSYSHPLVGLSVLISIFASYAALDLAGRVTSARGVVRRLWLGGGATAMGAGIWSMHYVGMLAFRLPVPVEYDWPTVVVSLLAAIGASLIALIVVSQTTMSWVRAFFGSVFMGSGIAGMHYIGMAAMRLPAMCRYSIPLVVTSIILAVAIALVALLLTFRFRNETRSGGWQKALCALVMGVAVPVMHYTGMAAASFSPAEMMDGDLSHSLSISSVGTAGIILVTFMILGLTILTSLVDRRFTAQTLELEATEKRSRQILETSFDAFVAMDAQGRIIDWNQQAKSMLGWSAEEIHRKCFPETIISDSCREAYNREIGRLLVPDHEGTLNQRFESVAVHRDGKEIPVEITVTAMRRAQSRNLAAFVRDVSQQKHAEESLQSFLKELEDLNFALDQHTIVARTDERGIITLANDNFCSISKYDRTELIGQDHRIINSGYHSKEFIGDLWATIKAGRVWKGEFKNRAKDGTEYWVATTIVPFKNFQGKIQQYISIRTDITPLKRAEEVSRGAQEAAEAASRAKSDFLANMSHEIRTPMNGIIGISDLLAQTNLDSEQRNYVGLVSNSAQSLLSVLNDILDFSKIESGKLDFSFVPVGLRQSLLSILKVFAMQASKKQIELTLLVSDDVPELIMADELRVRQVLNNLIGNALKFTAHGEIAVGVDLEDKTDRAITLHFRVRDTGVGIPADKLKLISSRSRRPIPRSRGSMAARDWD
jgi:PAS domain S-box-containing protein